MISIRADRSLLGGTERRGWWVVVEGTQVVDVRPSRPVHGQHLDLGAVDLLPGLVDLHSDCLELKARPRASMELPIADAILNLDTEAAFSGITSHFLCVCLEDDIGKYRSLARARQTVSILDDLRSELRVDHFLHLRVDVTGEGVSVAGQIARNSPVGIISYMVHLPGVGQFADEASWRSYYTTVEGDGDATVAERLRRRRGRLLALADTRAEVASIAFVHGAALASHDDDSRAAVEVARQLGVRISEFPVTAEAAQLASAAGMAVLMGAPNARAGRSHHGNLSARDALAAGTLTALASDYHPPSLLPAAYSLADERLCSWADAMALVTASPAAAAGLEDRGRIAPMLRADLVAVGRRANLASVEHLWVGGKKVL